MARSRKRADSPSTKKKRSAAAQKDWATRRRNERAAAEARRRRADAAIKGWAKRRAAKSTQSRESRDRRKEAARNLARVPMSELVRRVARNEQAMRQAAKIMLRGREVNEAFALLERADRIREERIEAHRAIYDRLSRRRDSRTVSERWHDLVDDFDIETDYETWDDLFSFYH